MLKRLFTPGRTQAFDKEIPAGSDNIWVAFEGSNYGLPMEPGTYAVTVVADKNVGLGNKIAVLLFEGNSYEWLEHQPGVATRMHWKSPGELRFRATSTNGGCVTVLVTPVTNSLSLSLVEYAAAWLRRWHHGAKAHRFPRPGGVQTHRQRQHLGSSISIPRALGNSIKQQYQYSPRPLQGGNLRPQHRIFLQRGAVGEDGRPGNPHRLPRSPRIRHTNLRERRRHHHHHTPRLTPVGGGC